MPTDALTSLPVKTKTAGDVVAKIVDSAGTNLLGVDSGGRVTINSAFAGNADAQTATANGQAIGLAGYNGTNWDRLQVDASKYLKVNVAAGTLSVSWPLPGNSDATTAAANQAAGMSGFNGTTWDRLRTLSTAADAVTSPAVGTLQTVGFNFGYNGTTWDRLQVDASKYLKVNVAAGSLAVTFPLPGNADGTTAATAQNTGISAYNGTTIDRLRTLSTAADAVTSPTVGTLQTVGFSFGYNGATWDRLQVDASKYLKVNVSAALPTGANTIGNVGLVAGSAKVGIVTTDQTTHGTTDLVAADITKVNGTALGSPSAAGTPASGNILTIQGNASGVPIPVSGSFSVSPGTLKSSGQVITGSTVAANGSATLASGTFVTNAKVGTLQHAIFTASVPCRFDLQTVNTSSVATTVFSAFTTAANLTYEFKAQNAAEIATVTSNGTTVQFQVVINNEDNTNAASGYATFWWAEN